MRKLIAVLFALLFVVGGSASVTAAQSNKLAAAGSAATPAASPVSKATAATGNVDPKVGETATFYAESGKPVAEIKVTKVDRPWKGYGQYEEPNAGTEYVAFTVEVKNVSSSNLKVQSFDFTLQDALGHEYGTAYVKGKDNAKIAPLTSNDLRVEGGKSATFLLVFNLNEDTKLAHLFWRADDHSLVTVANLAGK